MTITNAGATTQTVPGAMTQAGPGTPDLRWGAQRLDAETPGTLPGLARVAGLVKSVRTPEFQGVTFHEVLAKSALNHVSATSRVLPGEYTINPYRGCTHACVYCYARPTHDYVGMGIGEEFDSQIVVKTNIAEVLQSELARKRVLPERVALGTNTDPYQRAEGRYALMPGIIQALTDARVPFSILTKGSLIRRDLDLLERASKHVRVELGLSIAVLDDDLQHTIEPGTPSAAARLATVRAIRERGLDCTVFMSPTLPYLTDSEAQIDALVGALADAGVTRVLSNVLYLLPGVKELYFGWLERERPDLLPTYRGLYANGTRTPDGYQRLIKGRVRAALLRHGIPVPDDETADRFGLLGPRGRVTAQPEPAPMLF